MKAKRTFIKMAHRAAKAYYSADIPADISDLRWMAVQRRIRNNLIVVRKIYGLNQKQCADLLGLNPKVYQCHGKGAILSQPSVRVAVFTALSYTG